MSDVSASTNISADTRTCAVEVDSAPDAARRGGSNLAFVAPSAPSNVADDEARTELRDLRRRALRSLGPRRISAVYLWVAFLALFGLLEPYIYLSSVTIQLIFSEGVVTCSVALPRQRANAVLV